MSMDNVGTTTKLEEYANADFRNLLKEPILLKCSSCGRAELTRVEEHSKCWADAINRLTYCLFYVCCCCVCFHYRFPFTQTVYNHYCRSCGCHLGRAD